MSAFIVAEVGVNHMGSRGAMLTFCEAAKDIGADAVKFQAYNALKLFEKRQLTDFNVAELLQATELSDDDFAAISEHCKTINLKWFASVFDPDQPARVLNHGACALKIGHAEADWTELRDACLKLRKEVWVSGAQNHWAGGDIRGVLCTQEYPAKSPPRLGLIPACYSGFSSHYQDYRIPAAAALRYASYIEAHLKLSDDDYEAKWSLSIADFKNMVKLIREYESWR